MRAVLYARTSSDDRERDSMSAQLEMCRAYAEGQGWEVVAELREDERGQSGADLVTPMLQAAYDMAAAGQFDVLVAREPDRISRAGIEKLIIVRYELQRRGARLAFAHPDYQEQDDSMVGRITDAIRAEVAREERQKIVERMQGGRRRSLEQGSIQLSRPPYGYQVVNVAPEGQRAHYVLQIDEEQARVVRRIFELYTSGLSLVKIAKTLNEQGIPSPRGKRWLGTAIHHLLDNAVYRGVWETTRGGESFVIEVPAIVETAVWEAARAQRAKNRKRSRRNNSYAYLMRGRLTCGVCGGSVIGYTAGVYYRCGSQLYYHHDPAIEPCDNRQAYRVDQVDPLVWAWVQQTLLEPGAIMRTYELNQQQQVDLREPTQRELERVERAIEKQEQQRGRLLDLYLGGQWEPAELDSRKAKIEAELSALKEERGRLVDTLEADYLSLDEAERLQAFVDEWREELADFGDDPDDFEYKRRLVEALGVVGVLWEQEGEKLLQLTSSLGGDETLLVNSPVYRTVRSHGILIVSGVMTLGGGDLPAAFFHVANKKPSKGGARLG